MVRTESPICDFDLPAIDFNLKGVDGKRYNLESLKGSNGLLVMFICNHCPYVNSIIQRIISDTKALIPIGINSVAIMSNDANAYQEDSFENMKIISSKLKFPFPYLLDDTQEVAKSYGAVCTPDFFGYNKELGLQYRGRFDESRRESAVNARRDLFEAMSSIASTGKGPREQIPSIGCSIKWIE